MADIKNSATLVKKHDFTNCKCQDSSGGIGGDDCITKWKEEKVTADSTLKVAIAEVESRSESLKYAVNWEAKLKMYFDNIYKTAELADKVVRELNGFKTQTEKVCINADCTVTAIELLFCEVREIFEPNVRFLVQIMDRVNDCIKCITDPGLVRDEGILKVLAEYDGKLRELEGLQLDALKKIIEALKCANILYYSICSANDDKSNKEQYLTDALENELTVLCEAFGAGGQENGSNNALQCDSLTVDCTDPTSEVIKLLPVPVFPLSSDPYYTNTECQYGKAQDDKNTKKEALDEAKENKEAAQACFDSLVKAIDTAEAAKRGN